MIRYAIAEDMTATPALVGIALPVVVPPKEGIRRTTAGTKYTANFVVFGFVATVICWFISHKRSHSFLGGLAYPRIAKLAGIDVLKSFGLGKFNLIFPSLIFETNDGHNFTPVHGRFTRCGSPFRVFKQIVK